MSKISSYTNSKKNHVLQKKKNFVFCMGFSYSSLRRETAPFGKVKAFLARKFRSLKMKRYQEVGVGGTLFDKIECFVCVSWGNEGID